MSTITNIANPTLALLPDAAVDSNTQIGISETDQKIEQLTKKNEFQCPGHTEFFHRYAHREKAKRKATEEVIKYESRENVKKAIYKLISKNTPEGKNSVYFSGLNKIYNHAIDIIFYHVDGCIDCEFNPLFEAKK